MNSPRLPNAFARSEWPVGSRMKPGDKGTRKLLREYGQRLICVRYRYDERTARRLTTVEIAVREAPWKPRPFRLVFVEVLGWEYRLRDSVRHAGGRWDPARRLWHLRYDRAMKLGLADRIRSKPLVRKPSPQKSLSAETKKSLPAATSAKNSLDL
jgi:hypothetical protein